MHIYFKVIEQHTNVNKTKKNKMLRLYNYNLETGTVGVDDKNLANILYNINRMETKVPYNNSDMVELNEDIDELFFWLTEAKVCLADFLEIFSENENNENVDTVAAAIEESIDIVDKAMDEDYNDEPDIEIMRAAFPTVYKKLLAIVPNIVLLDEQTAYMK